MCTALWRINYVVYLFMAFDICAVGPPGKGTTKVNPAVP